MPVRAPLDSLEDKFERYLSLAYRTALVLKNRQRNIPSFSDVNRLKMAAKRQQSSSGKFYHNDLLCVASCYY